MGFIDVFEVTIDNQQPVYFSGQTIQGRVTLKVNSGKEIRGITKSVIDVR